jgi:hypothetical protein
MRAANDPVWNGVTPAASAARDLTVQFEGKPNYFLWQVERKPIAEGLRDRIIDPGLIQQGTAGLCGPASTLFDLASRDPVAYVQFVIDLYEKAEANLGTIPIKAKRNLTSRPIPAGVPAVDWLPMASIRSSENNFMRYVKDKDYFRGMTLPHEIVSWLRSLGYTDIVNRTSLLFDRSRRILEQASQHFDQGDRVILFINGKLMYTDQMSKGSLLPNHWVVQTAPFIFMRDSVSVAVFSWGESRYSIPRDGSFMPIKDFLNHFYGYIAASM